MGWNTYIVNQTGRDVWCFWSTNPGMAAGWDSIIGFPVPAGLSCSANRAGLYLFGLGAMFGPYPHAQPAGSPGSPLGVPSLAPSAPSGFGFAGAALNGIPVVWANWNSSQGNACSHWGFRLVTNTETYQWEPSGFPPGTMWTYQPPLPQVAQSQNWVRCKPRSRLRGHRGRPLRRAAPVPVRGGQ
jgi:hypothetical protein